MGLAVVIALVGWAQGLYAEPWLLALVLLVSCAVRATVDGRRWRRRRQQLSAGEQVLRRRSPCWRSRWPCRG